MGKIRLKIKLQPPPPLSLIPPLIGFLIPNLRVGCLPQAQKVLQMTLPNNQTVCIYKVQFIAIKCNSWVFHSL